LSKNKIVKMFSLHFACIFKHNLSEEANQKINVIFTQFQK
jgi:hypothetical protein